MILNRFHNPENRYYQNQFVPDFGVKFKKKKIGIERKRVGKHSVLQI